MSTTFAPQSARPLHGGYRPAQRTTVRRAPSMSRPIRPATIGYAVVVPPRVRTGVPGPERSRPRPSGSVFVRRRLAVLLVVVATAAALGLGVGTVLASRGGDPASVPAARPANPSGTPAYPARAGDTMWSIAAMFHGERSHADYLDDMIRLNGGHTEVAVGQLVLLP